MKRREFVFAAASAAAMHAMPVRAQGKMHRIALLSGGTKPDTALLLAALLEGMREFGYQEGRHFTLEARYADYSAERALKLAAEVAALKPAVIVANGGGIAPAYRLSPSLPLVFLQSGNPVDAGFADSFARPGRHATGVSLMALDLIAKRLDLLRRVQPKLRRVAFIASPEHAGQKRELAASQAAADQLALSVSYHEARNPAELVQALEKVAAERPDAALLFSDALMSGQRQMLADFFLKHRIPSAASWSAFVDSGHLLSYGPERRSSYRRLAYFVDQIIKGTPPGAIPIELPAVVELVVNRQTAASLGLALPQEILLRADRIVEGTAKL
ncbi:MAG TPA: ABC transporter substrate-binding protein [Burkholderiales bacterium]